MASCRCLCLFLAALQHPSVADEARPDPAHHAALGGDDACLAEDGEDCALSALQVHARSPWPSVSPAAKADFAGVPPEELGSDELMHNLEAFDIWDLSDEPLRADVGFDGLDEPQYANDSNSSEPERGYCLSRTYTGRRYGSEECFCQLAGNPGCRHTGCKCPQGCRGVTWDSENSVSFKNKARAHGCHPSVVLLTSPRSYFADMQDLKAHHNCTVDIISELLRDGFNTYQEYVARKEVWQCFHGSRVASVKYLHLQTFGADCNFHGMPTRNHRIAMCVRMREVDEASRLAKHIRDMIPR